MRASTWWLLGGLGAAVLLFAYTRTKRGQETTQSVSENVAVGVAVVGNFFMSRGYRNNNPGNIRFIAKNPWNGQTGNDGGYGVYDTPQNGTRAMGRQLRKYEQEGYNTVRKIIARWAPSNENDTNAYVKHVADLLNIDPDQPFSVYDRLAELGEAIAKHENGYASSDYNWQWVYS